LGRGAGEKTIATAHKICYHPAIAWHDQLDEIMADNTRQKARDLRRRMTDAELLLWQKLRGGRFLGVKFYRQKPVGPYIVDFVAPSRNLVIELDGGQHAESAAMIHDAARTRFLESRGYTVLRFWNHDCLARTEDVLGVVERWLRQHGEQVSS
jgi:very-short-patch-repair endonuclease